MRFRLHLVALFSMLAALSGPAWAGMPGDVDGNCKVDVADVVLYERWLQGGAPMIDPELLGNADVAPFDSNPSQAPVITPDGVNDAADLVVMQRAVAGDVTLPLAPAAPVLGTPTTITNPLSLGFTLSLAQGVSATIEFKVNGHVQPDTSTVIGQSNGQIPDNTSFGLLALYDGANTITATAIVGGKRSCTSASVSATYTNQIDRSVGISPPAANGMLVLTPGVAGQGHFGPYKLNQAALFTEDTNGTKSFQIANGMRVILQPGVEIQFDSKNLFVVRTGGILRVQGQATNPVIFTSSQSSNPTNGYWKGIELRLSQGLPTKAVIDHASIRYAETGVRMRTVSQPQDDCCHADTIANVTNSEITNFSANAADVQMHAMGTIDGVTITGSAGTTGVAVTDTINSGSHATIVRNSTITGGHTGISIVRAAPEIRANIIKDQTGTLNGANNRDILIDGASSPVVEQNQLTGNGCDRISLTGDATNGFPQPTIHLNKIFAPTSSGCSRLQLAMPVPAPVVHAESNYWDTTNPEDVLHSLINKPSAAVVLTRPILNVSLQPIGTETVESGELSGAFVSGTTYLIDGPATIPVGQTLTIPLGATVKFNAESGANLQVNGTLQVSSTPSNRVPFTSSRGAVSTPPRSIGDWHGILLASASGVLDIDSADIQWADTAVQASNVTNTTEQALRVKNCFVGNSTEAFTLTNVASALIEANDVAVVPGHTAVEVVNSSPRLVSNKIENASTAIDVTGTASHPVIGPGNQIDKFSVSGISMTGTSAGSVIDGNTIHVTNNPQTAQGIVLTDTSPTMADATPTITNNTISQTYYGIHVFGRSNPSIGDGNVITGNVWGILLRGNRLATNPAPPPFNNPAPVIEGNQFANGCVGTCQSPLLPDPCSPAGGNICVSGYQYDAQSVIDIRENYWVNLTQPNETDSNAIRQKIFVELSNPVAVDFSNYLAGPSGAPVNFSAFTSIIEPFSISKDVIRPTFVTGDQVTISFNLLDAVDSLNVQFIEDKDQGATVRTIAVPNLAAGPHVAAWDGKDDGGLFVADFAYRVRVTAVKNGHTYIHELFRDPNLGGNYAFAELTASATTPWNGHRNQYSKAMERNLRANRPAMWAIVRWEDDFATAVRRALASGQERLMVFDGRSSSGQLLPLPGATTNHVVVGYHGEPAVRKAVFVQDTAPVVFGDRDSSAVPTISNVEVLSDPYLAVPTYDQVSIIKFKVDQPADVSVKILKPGAPNDGNPTDVVAQLAIDPINPEAPLLRSATWLGFDPSVTDADEVLQATQSGSYTFFIEARRPGQPTLKTTYRGTIQVRLAPGM